MNATYKKLFNSNKWMVRTSDNGKSNNGFVWKHQGEWTIAPDWTPEARCGGGLHGQNKQAFGYFQISGQRLELCETDEIPIAIDNNKCKCQRGKIIAVNDDIPVNFLTAIGLKFNGKPSLNALTSVGGDLYINSNADLPALPSVGGDLFIYSNVKADLPALTSVGGYLS